MEYGQGSLLINLSECLTTIYNVNSAIMSHNASHDPL